MMLILISLLLIKHFVCDFVLQMRYQYSNKGKYLHPGGLLHALITVTGTIVILHLLFGYEFSNYLLTQIVTCEFIIHYHMDWLKVKINEWMNWKPMNSEYFWWLLGFDQTVHLFNYVWIVWMIYGWK